MTIIIVCNFFVNFKLLMKTYWKPICYIENKRFSAQKVAYFFMKSSHIKDCEASVPILEKL
jgi:hypothetical protein